MNAAELLKNVRSRDDAVRESALTACMTAEELPPELLLAAIPSVNDPNAEIREAAVGVCERDQDWPASIVAGLIEILEHHTGDAAYWAATLLGRQGPERAPRRTGAGRSVGSQVDPGRDATRDSGPGQNRTGRQVAQAAVERYAKSSDTHLASTARDVLAGWGS
ncbi:MAG: hypothetical protein QM811_20265 [Pirellulales bacterium]